MKAKRNKKYDPRKREHQRISRLSENERKFFQESQVVRELSMRFCPDEVNDKAEEWSTTCPNGDLELMPHSMASEVYEGDLIICTRNRLINMTQIWEMEVDAFYVERETGEEITEGFILTTPLMSFEELRFGGGKSLMNRVHGVKSRWKGARKEVNDLIDELEPDDCVYSHCIITLKTKALFLNADAYRQFLSIKNNSGAFKVAA